MTTQEIILTIGVVSLVIFTACAVIFLVEFMRMSLEVRQFIRRTEANLHPILLSLQRVLDDVEKATKSVVNMAGIRKIADSLSSVEKTLKFLYESYKGGFSESTRANVAGLKAGIKTGLVTIWKNIREKKEVSS